MKEKIVGTSDRVLKIDLTTQTTTLLNISIRMRHMYLGGKGLGLNYLYTLLPPGIDPLGPENVLAVMTGALMGTGAPCTSRFAALTKSPLTGLIASSSCGGPFGMALKTAGYDGLLIMGVAEVPTILEINDRGVHFQNATVLWGQETHRAQAALDLHHAAGALVIGPAGENLVYYANVMSGRRFLGRAGFGAVMGSKQLKAVVARGGAYKIIPADPEKFNRFRKQALTYINNNPFTAQVYRQQGTAANVTYCNTSGILPVHNFRDGHTPQAKEVAGPAWQEKYQTKPQACQTCTILCGHKGHYPDGTQRKIPEYETISLFGPNLGIYDTEWITRWSERCDALGLDTISTAGTLAYVMEAGEKGLLNTELHFGSPEGIMETLDAIATRTGFGADLANGTRWLAQHYGGNEFAIQVKGLELPGYDPRGAWGQGLAYAVANRGGCHLSAAMMTLEAFFGFLDPHTTQAKPTFVCYLENLNAAVNALQTCVFTIFAYMLEPPLVKYTPPRMMRFFMQNFPRFSISTLNLRTFTQLYAAVTGDKLTPREFLTIGRRINTLERYMNTREGITRIDDTLPARFLKEGRTCDPQHHTVPLEKMLDRYYKIRGYDANGIPTPRTLAQLDITPQAPLSQTTSAHKQRVVELQPQLIFIRHKERR